ncbi:hypothetical protein [Baekduia sp. Peel2402]|uniref:hypothetical protein n=1 Tax=Baekduia sp. Peel2402 TaxID=3458296 RepID=UPI00403E6F84
MDTDLAHYTTHHFSLSNPHGPGFWHVPSLLRRLADIIEANLDVRVDDLTFRNEYHDDYDDLSVTVYYHLADDEERALEVSLEHDPTIAPPSAA